MNKILDYITFELKNDAIEGMEEKKEEYYA